MVAEAADPAPDSPARRLLVDQSRLVRWQIASERAGLALKVLTALAGLALAGLVLGLAWQASRADGVILEPFAVPPALAADGVSGQVVAAQVLDELGRLRTETVEAGRARAYANDWGRNVSVAIPATGVSLGDLQAALRKWLGHETRITGEVYRTLDGIALRARAEGGSPVQAEGPAGDLPRLARNIAQGIYRETQPVRYARYLTDHDDAAGAMVLAQTAALRSSKARTRAEAYAAWADAIERSGGDAQEAIALDLKAQRLAPDWWLPAFQLSNHEFNRGHTEAAVHHMRDAARLRARDPSLPKAERNVDFYLGRAASMVQESDRVRYFQRAAEDPATVAAIGSQLDRSLIAAPANAHDIATALARLRRPQYVRPWRTGETGSIEAARTSVLEAMEDWRGLHAAKEAPSAAAFGRRIAFDWAQLGFARVMTGDVEGGRALLDAQPLDCDPCQLYRARALAATGDWAAAERLAAVVEARTPSVPQGSFTRGLILLNAGRAEQALVSLREAERRGPKWADTYRFEGDALARLGRWSEADTAYAKAYALAPKWGGLHLVWGEALARLGRADEARAKWRTAVSLYLTVEERARLRAMLQQRTS